jgi:hypothetical protein
MKGSPSAFIVGIIMMTAITEYQRNKITEYQRYKHNYLIEQIKNTLRTARKHIVTP